MPIVLSPAPKQSSREGATFQASWSDYEERNHGDTGEFGFCFDLRVDMDTHPPEAQLVDNMKGIQESAGVESTQRSRIGRVRQLTAAHRLLQPGTHFWMKKGRNVFALAEITSPYRYIPEQRWGWHSWSYRIIRRATDEERSVTMGRQSFIADAKGL
jgi:hypothetical protein